MTALNSVYRDRRIGELPGSHNTVEPLGDAIHALDDERLQDLLATAERYGSDPEAIGHLYEDADGHYRARVTVQLPQTTETGTSRTLTLDEAVDEDHAVYRALK